MMRSVVAGVTPVLPTTKRRSTQPTDIHTMTAFPTTEVIVNEAIRAGNGASAYAIGKTNNAALQIRIVPKWSFNMGYITSWSTTPMAPRVDIANPTSRGCIARPPEKWKSAC